MSSNWNLLGVPIDSVAAPEGGAPFGTEQAPDALRALGIVGAVGASDRGDLPVRITGPDRDPDSGLVGWPSLAAMTRSIRGAVSDLLAEEPAQPLLMLGGCCALVPGAVAGVRDALGSVGLVSLDGHLDLYDQHTSPTGEAADMPVAALLGRGYGPWLAELGDGPVLGPADVTVLGARDPIEAADLGDLPAALGVAARGPDALGTASGTWAVQRIDPAPVWVHLDVDVFDEQVFPATDYLMPGGSDLATVTETLAAAVATGRVVGVSVGCYNPSKDPGGRNGGDLVEMLRDALL